MNQDFLGKREIESDLRLGFAKVAANVLVSDVVWALHDFWVKNARSLHTTASALLFVCGSRHAHVGRDGGRDGYGSGERPGSLSPRQLVSLGHAFGLVLHNLIGTFASLEHASFNFDLLSILRSGFGLRFCG